MPGHSTLQIRSAPSGYLAPAGVVLPGPFPTHLKRGLPSVRMRLLDDPALYIGDRELPLTSRKAKALVSYLVLAPGMRDSRERLAGLLWSESENEKARACLRQLLHYLRESFDAAGVEGLSTDKSHVGLDASIFGSDLDEALASVDQGAPADILIDETNVIDAFLRGYDDIDPSFGSWLTVKRENLRQMFIRRLEAQLTYTTHGPEASKRIARALFQIDPTHEIACQKLMQACMASGNAGGALAAYKLLWDRLDEEYDIEPSTATQEIVVAIKSGHAVADSTPDGTKAGAIRTGELDPVTSLAVKLALSWMTAWDMDRTNKIKR
jgi:DNA-binding SARP family transcriptional activator